MAIFAVAMMAERADWGRSRYAAPLPLNANLSAATGSAAPQAQRRVAGHSAASFETGVQRSDSRPSETAENALKNVGRPSPPSVPLPLLPPVPARPDKAPEQVVAAAEQPVYFRRSQLTLSPVLLDSPEIDLPDEGGPGQAGQKKADGRLVLRISINAAGGIDRVETIESTMPAVYEEAISAAFLPLRFRPGEIDGIKVNAQTDFAIDLEAPRSGSSRASDRANRLGDAEPAQRP